MCIRRKVLMVLVGRIAGRNEQNAIQPEFAGRSFGSLQVAVVNRVEGSAEKSDIHSDVSSTELRGGSASSASGAARGAASSALHSARFNSSSPSPVTAEISCKVMPCSWQKPRRDSNFLLFPAASMREAASNIGLRASFGLKLSSSDRITR